MGEHDKEAQAIMIFCCTLGATDGVVPFKNAEWRKLAQIMVARKIQPSELLEMDVLTMVDRLGVEEKIAERLVALIGRSASLSFEITKLEKEGIGLVTRADKEYPAQLKKKMGDNCPPYFFYVGDLGLLREKCVGFVGSRKMTTEDVDFESKLVEKVVKARYGIVSGGANGADKIAEEVGLARNGKVIEFLSGRMLEKMRSSRVVKAIQGGKLLLMSCVAPKAGFSVGAAMGRNKFIFTQSEATIAIKSEGKSGTWAGVTECLKEHYAPVYCWNNPKYSENLELIKMGALPIDEKWEVKEIELRETTEQTILKQPMLL